MAENNIIVNIVEAKRDLKVSQAGVDILPYFLIPKLRF